MMKKRNAILVCTLILAFVFTMQLPAQEIKGGVVTYEQTTRYNFNEMFNIGPEDTRHQDFFANLPQQSAKTLRLKFINDEALFEPDPEADNALSPGLTRVLSRAEYIRPPQMEINQIYWNLTKEESVREIIFMTREFVVTGEVEKHPWKLQQKQTKILEFICTAAEMQEGEDTILAWFTPQIPVSLGPAHYTGLPGLVLAVEVNGVTVFLAKSVTLTPPSEGEINPPDKGKEMSREAFDQMVAEKLEEWEKTREANRRRNQEAVHRR